MSPFCKESRKSRNCKENAKRVEKVQPVKENLGAAKEVSCILKLLPSHKGSKVVTTVILLLIIIFLLLLLILLLLILLLLLLLIIITRPKPAFGRQGLARSWGQNTDEVSTFLVFLTSHFAPAALSLDLNQPETINYNKNPPKIMKTRPGAIKTDLEQ